MRILIADGAGFIGSHIADLLAAQGHSVLLLDAFLPQEHSMGSPPAWVAEDELIRGDVRDGELLSRLLPEVDAVCHQAAMVGHGLDPSDAPDYTANSDLGTAVLLAAMHKAHVRRPVLASSMGRRQPPRPRPVQHCAGHRACARQGGQRSPVGP